MEKETQMGHGLYSRDSQGLLRNTKIEANNSHSIQRATCNNRDVFQAQYVSEEEQVILGGKKEGLSQRGDIYFGC